MELTEAIHGRRATRAFTRESVATPLLERLVDAALQAPSAFNAQPWDFTIIRDRALLDRISVAAKAHMRAVTEGGSLPHGLHENLENPDFHVFYHAPALIVISATGEGWAAEHAALAAQNLMLAAHAEGLGSCWIGFAQRWLETEDGRHAIAVPDDFMPVAPIIVGHPAAPMPPVPRKPACLRWIG
ncbi:nitroreductase family protein [Roseixanthobacter liquoris]|uniref:nitroreductase family protein n=1 Tax=Roseixanthobacter liquoris TaxID=3119921 RepID=UPI00372A18C8